MKRLTAILLFVAMTFLCWGTYGPVLHIGQEAMGHSRWRPFICVGMAYFVIAVVVPWLMMGRSGGEQGKWTVSGTIWSFAAGIITAIGALGIILAFNYGGKPVYVMPLVFGGAPIANTLVTMWMTGSQNQLRWPFFVAILMVALGAAGVFRFKPKPVKAAPEVTAEVVESSHILMAQASDADTDTDSSEEATEDSKEEDASHDSESAAPQASMFKIFLSIFTTVVCWGSYGPLLHRGQVKMGNSRLRPLICVGLAYFAIAVILPCVILYQGAEPDGRFGIYGTIWSLAAGALGAFGSLGIILAFTSGGKPVYVMPLIFGMAPVINTLTSMGKSYWNFQTVGEIPQMFVASLCVVILGAIGVLIFAPKNKPKPPADPPANPKDEPKDESESEDSGGGDESVSDDSDS